MTDEEIDLRAKVLEYEHALEHIADTQSHVDYNQPYCTDCANLAQGALERTNRDMCVEMVLGT